MKILIVAATANEIAPTINHLKMEDGLLLNNLNIEILITGVGMIATTYQLTKKIKLNPFDLVINAGIAGAFNNQIKIGEVLNITQDCFSEMGAENDTHFLSLTELGLLQTDEFPFNNGIIFNQMPVNSKLITELKQSKGITVNTVHGNDESIKKCINYFNADTESMEGASVFYVCKNENVPCIQIRSISNYVEKRNRDNWNVPLAINNLNNFLITLLSELDHNYGN